MDIIVGSKESSLAYHIGNVIETKAGNLYYVVLNCIRYYVNLKDNIIYDYAHSIGKDGGIAKVYTIDTMKINEKLNVGSED